MADDFSDPVLPDSAPPDHGKNISPEQEAALAFPDWETRTDELIEAADVWLKEVGEIDTDEHANRCDSFLTQLQEHWRTVEAGRKAEKVPHDDAGKAVQAKYVPVLDRIKKAGELLKGNLKGFLRKKEAEKAEAERVARLAAQAEQRIANEAARKAAEAETVDAVVEAEAAQKQADAKRAEAGRIERSSAGVKGDYSKKARTIRKVWTAGVTDLDKAYKHYRDREEVRECLTKLAAADARAAGKEIDIPGCRVYQKESG